MASARPRIPGLIAHDLGIKIVSGRFKPGTVLEGEIAASGQRKVSRSAYREAVRILIAKGLVESKPKLGTRVSETARWHLLDPDVLSWIFEGEPSNAQLAGLFELRNIVAPDVAALAAARRGEAHLAEMAAALAAMARHTLRTPEGRLADQQFHIALLAACSNPFLGSLTSGIAAAVAWTTVFKQRLQPLRRDPVPDHAKVYKAVQARNAAAARRAMRELVDLAFLDTANAWPKARGRTKPKKKARRFKKAPRDRSDRKAH
jgi:DNA-binding FadR family transcriptional regulator